MNFQNKSWGANLALIGLTNLFHIITSNESNEKTSGGGRGGSADVGLPKIKNTIKDRKICQ